MDSRSTAGLGGESVGPAEGQRTIPWWVWHGLSWALACGLLAIAFRDESKPASTPAPGDDPVGLVVLVVGLLACLVLGLVYLLRQWERIGPMPGFSLSVVLFAGLLLIVTGALSVSREWGVHIPSCHVVAGAEECAGEATGREILGLLAWNAADVVPALDIPSSVEWSRPARSDDALVGLSLIVVRLWVVVGVLGVVRRLWSHWETGAPRKSVVATPDGVDGPGRPPVTG